MGDQPSADDYRSRIKPKLQERFDPQPETLESVLTNIEEARQMDELAGLHWEAPDGIVEGIENFSKGYGLKAGWNSWIGIQRTDTSHLVID